MTPVNIEMVELPRRAGGYRTEYSIVARDAAPVTGDRDRDRDVDLDDLLDALSCDGDGALDAVLPVLAWYGYSDRVVWRFSGLASLGGVADGQVVVCGERIVFAVPASGVWSLWVAYD